MRQVAAIAASGDRIELLKKITAPTLIIHGRADQLVPVKCGIDTAKLIPNAQLELIDGMGHDLPKPLLSRFIELINNYALNPAQGTLWADNNEGYLTTNWREAFL